MFASPLTDMLRQLLKSGTYNSLPRQLSKSRQNAAAPGGKKKAQNIVRQHRLLKDSSENIITHDKTSNRNHRSCSGSNEESHPSTQRSLIPRKDSKKVQKVVIGVHYSGATSSTAKKPQSKNSQKS